MTIRSEGSDIFNRLRAVVNRVDPEGLIGCGCPDDEYDSEIKMIIQRISAEDDEERILNIIYQVFEEMFGHISETHKDKYREIAWECFRIKALL